jgi:hypothetical protein
MTHLEFCHWLDGYLTLSSNLQLTPKKLTIIRNHLELVETVSGPASGFLLQLKQQVNSLLDNLDAPPFNSYESIMILVNKSIKYDVGTAR